MLGFILYSVGVLSVGFAFGMSVKHIIDLGSIRQLEAKNGSLHRENEHLKKEIKHEVIEIVDHRAEPEVKFGGF